MVAVNQEQLIGSLIPDVYIKAVTLETSGTPIRETNPHIDHSREALTVVKKPSDNFLIINLDLLLKEQLTTGAIGTWFSNQDFKKYLRLTVVQSTDSLVTKLLSASNNALQIANNTSPTEAAVFLAELMGELKQLPEFSSIGSRAAAYSEDDLPELIELVENNTEAKYIPVSTDRNTVLEQQYSSTTSTGERVYDFTFRVRFEVPTKTPEHLTYFAVSTLDVDKLVDDFKLDANDTHLFDLMNGKVAADNIIANGSLVSKSFVYKDRDGNIWSGPVHQADANGGWFTGTAESEIKNPVKRETVENNKIQDFRDFDSMERLQLDFSVVQNAEFNRNLPFIRLTNDNMDVSRTENYFSDIALSKDSLGGCRCAFALDYGKIIRDHSKYGALYNSSNLDELFNSVEIRSLVFKRRRVKKKSTTLNQLGSPTDKRGVFDIDEPDEILSYGGEDSPGQFIASPTARGFMREAKFAMNKEYNELRHFTGVDRSMSTTTDGIYQYGIEIEVQDNSVQLIEKKITELTWAKFSLDSYYNTATLPNHFDVVSNRFTQEFIDKMYGQWDQEALLPNAPWIRPLVVYMDALTFFRKKEVDIKFAAALPKYTDPKSGNPRGVLMVIKLIENIVQRLSAVVGINLSEQRLSNTKDSEGNFTRPSSLLTPGKPPVRTFKIEYYFPQTHDSNMPKNLGYDYLSHGNLEMEQNKDGLKFISTQDYTKRVNLETLKYFTSTTPNIDMIVNSVSYTSGDTIDKTRQAYLSPSNVSLGTQGNISLLDDAFNESVSLTVQCTIANMNLTRNSPIRHGVTQRKKHPHDSRKATQNKIKTRTSLENIMAERNCTVVATVSSPTHSPKREPPEERDPYTDVVDMFGESWENIDPIQTGASDENDVSEGDTKDDPSNLYSEIAHDMINEGVGMGSLNSEQKTIDAHTNREKKAQRQRTYTADYYNLSSSPDAKYNLSTKKDAVPAQRDTTMTVSNDSLVNPELQFKLSVLPNQIKSLFLMHTPNSPVKNNWSIGATTGKQRASRSAVLNLNYNTLRKIEVLVGYETDANNSPILKKPQWVPLTETILEGALEEGLLCRQVKYENKEFGVYEPVGLRLPVYNKYFIIGNDAEPAGTSTTRVFDKRYQDKLILRIKINSNQHRHLSSEYMATQWVSSNTVKVNPDTRQRVLETLDLSKKITQPNETSSQ